MLENYIKELLFIHECVIVPDFGGFIAQYVTADIHPVTHRFHPPAKTVAFNKQLNIGDGLLVSYIARKENISWDAANIKVKEAVLQVKHQLSTFGVVVFNEIGRLYSNESLQIEFEPQMAVNFLEDSFGLTELYSKPIERNFSEISKPPLKMSKNDPKKPTLSQNTSKDSSNDRFLVDVDGEVESRSIPWLGVLSVALLLSCMGFLLYMNHNGRSLASIIPYKTKSSNLKTESEKKPVIVANADDEPSMPVQDQLSSERPMEPEFSDNDAIAPITTSHLDAAHEKAALSNTSKNPKRASTKLSNSTAAILTKKQGLYYIIIGSFGEKTNALKLHNRVSSVEQKAVILGPGSGNNIFYKVALTSYPTLSQAAENLSTHQQTYTGAWVLGF